MVGSKSGVVVGCSSSRGHGRLDGGVGELLVGQRKARVNEGRQFMFMVYEENLCAQKVINYMYNSSSNSNNIIIQRYKYNVMLSKVHVDCSILLVVYLQLTIVDRYIHIELHPTIIHTAGANATSNE